MFIGLKFVVYAGLGSSAVLHTLDMVGEGVYMSLKTAQFI
jgi:hypothetical protein